MNAPHPTKCALLAGMCALAGCTPRELVSNTISTSNVMSTMNEKSYEQSDNTVVIGESEMERAQRTIVNALTYTWSIYSNVRFEGMVLHWTETTYQGQQYAPARNEYKVDLRSVASMEYERSLLGAKGVQLRDASGAPLAGLLVASEQAGKDFMSAVQTLLRIETSRTAILESPKQKQASLEAERMALDEELPLLGRKQVRVSNHPSNPGMKIVEIGRNRFHVPKEQLQNFLEKLDK